jgi:hypothetical protein
MKRYRWQILLGLALILASILLYLIDYEVFGGARSIFIFIMGSIAFVPVEVLLVTLIINGLLSQREKKTRLEKMNMVIGSFFSEVGTLLLTYFSDFDPELAAIRKHLIVTNNWSDEEFVAVSKRLRNYDYKVEIRKIDMEGLKGFLVSKRDFLLRLLENPALLEHETFTELLRSVFHFSEELERREKVTGLTDSDYEHLTDDVNRAYTLLVQQWLEYVKYLKDNYPYLFSLAMRTNPFDQTASPFVK